MPYFLRQFFMALPFKLREEDKIKHMAWSFCLTLMALAVLSPVLAFGAVFLTWFGQHLLLTAVLSLS